MQIASVLTWMLTWMLTSMVISRAQEEGFPSQRIAVAEAAKAAAAMARSPNPVTDVEKALIDALQIRMAWPHTPFAPLLLRTFATAMRDVYKRFGAPNAGGDPDVVMVFAESLMNLKPWRLWSRATGKPEPEAIEIRRVLEAAIDMHPDHPGLLHLCVIDGAPCLPSPQLPLQSACASASVLRLCVWVGVSLRT